MTGSDQPAQAPKHGRHGSHQRATHGVPSPQTAAQDPRTNRSASADGWSDGHGDKSGRESGTIAALARLESSSLPHRARAGVSCVCGATAPAQLWPAAEMAKLTGAGRMVDDRARSRSAASRAQAFATTGAGCRRGSSFPGVERWLVAGLVSAAPLRSSAEQFTPAALIAAVMYAPRCRRDGGQRSSQPFSTV